VKTRTWHSTQGTRGTQMFLSEIQPVIWVLSVNYYRFFDLHKTKHFSKLIIGILVLLAFIERFFSICEIITLKKINIQNLDNEWDVMWKYDVLVYLGSDVRYRFTRHLYSHLIFFLNAYACKILRISKIVSEFFLTQKAST